MNFVVRPFTPDDYPGLADVLTIVEPQHPTTADDIRNWDEHREAKIHSRRWVAEINGQIIASGVFSQNEWAYHPQKFYIIIRVHPDYRRQGIGSALYQAAYDALRAHDPTVIQAAVMDNEPEGQQFALKHGYVEYARRWESRADAASFDPTPYRDLDAQLANKGITIKSLEEIEASEPRDRRLHHIFTETLLEVPYPDPVTPPDFDAFKEQILYFPTVLTAGSFVALDGDELIGLTINFLNEADNSLSVVYTGVLPAYRGKGVGLALKIRPLLYAQEHGHPTLSTENDT
jgi:mycothiol synthase